MTDKFDLLNEISKLLAILNAGELPEAYGCLEAIHKENEAYDSPYMLATALMGCDVPKNYPAFLIDFIIGLYEAEIAEGNENAMNDLGAMYYSGKRGCEQSYDKAVSCYETAAQKGHPIAHENLGYCWYYGRTGRKDYEKAFRYFAYGALCGSLTSLYKIGDMYLNGYYLPQSDEKAFQMYLRCMTLMTEEQASIAAGPAYLRLGKMYLSGVGTERDSKAALVCFQKAEVFLYDMVASGEIMYKNSLKAAAEGQAKARAALTEALSDQNLDLG